MRVRAPRAWRKVLYFPRHVVDEGATMCDEDYDARMKAFWRLSRKRTNERSTRKRKNRSRSRLSSRSPSRTNRNRNRSPAEPLETDDRDRIPREAEPPSPKNYIRPLHRDGPTRRPDAPGQSLRGSRKCGPDSSGLAGSVTVSRPNARGSSYARRDHSPRRSGQCRRNTDRDTDRWAFRPASGARARFRTSRAGRTWTAARLGSKDSPATRRA